jgi:hypothetical protein
LADDFNYWVSTDSPVSEDAAGNWTIGQLTFPRGKNPDGLTPQIVTSVDGRPAIRLAVRHGTFKTSTPDDVNDRCELREPKSPFGTEAWYGFSMRVPREFPVQPLRCVLAQIKMPYDDQGNGSPAFALRIDEGRFVASVEHLYELEDEQDSRFLTNPVNGVCGFPAAFAYDHHDFSNKRDTRDLQIRAVMATDADGLPAYLAQNEFTRCTTGIKLTTYGKLPVHDGSWIDVIFHVRPSGRKDADGIIELWVNGEAIATAAGELGFASPDQRAPQYFKIGPYRNNEAGWGDDDAWIEVRDIRRGSTRDGVEQRPIPVA